MSAITRNAPQPNLKPIKSRDFGYDQARHLLWRAGFGGTPEQIETLAAWGPERSVDHLLALDTIEYAGAPDANFDKDIMRPLTQEEQQQYQQARRNQNEDVVARFRAMRQQAQRRDRGQIREAQRWWLERMIETPKPLEEKMTLFWHGHFATSYRTIENSYHMVMQNNLFRANAIGNFGELLFQIIRDPAMIAYLDNNDSRKGQPNENLARELMELFSLGVGNYTERDIKEGARALTGYSFNDDEFAFNQRNHDTGSKRILGVTGNLDGDGFVRAILGQRACAEFMSRKLYDFFVSHIPTDTPTEIDPPTTRVLRQLTSKMLSSRYELKPVLRDLFLSEHFYHDRFLAEHVKSPVELVVGAIRSLNTPVRDLSILVDALDLMGQDLMFPPSVKGWDGGRSWINTSTLFVRQNVLAFLLTGKKPVGYDALVSEDRYDPTPLLDRLAAADPAAAKDPDRIIDYLIRHTIGRPRPTAHETLRAFVASHGDNVTPDMLTGVLMLITAMPEYQLA